MKLQLTSRKKLTLINVFYIPDVSKNLVSANPLCKSGMKLVFETDKLILTKFGAFVGKGYSCD